MVKINTDVLQIKLHYVDQNRGIIRNVHSAFLEKFIFCDNSHDFWASKIHASTDNSNSNLISQHVHYMMYLIHSNSIIWIYSHSDIQTHLIYTTFRKNINS